MVAAWLPVTRAVSISVTLSSPHVAADDARQISVPTTRLPGMTEPRRWSWSAGTAASPCMDWPFSSSCLAVTLP